MERPGAGDNARALRFASATVMATNKFNARLDGFGTRVAEKHRIGERMCNQSISKPFLLWNSVQIGRVPQLGRLLG